MVIFELLFHNKAKGGEQLFFFYLSSFLHFMGPSAVARSVIISLLNFVVLETHTKLCMTEPNLF